MNQVIFDFSADHCGTDKVVAQHCKSYFEELNRKNKTCEILKRKVSDFQKKVLEENADVV